MDSLPIRVLIAKPGLDGHDRGAKVVVKALRDAGMEVIYTGRHQKIASIVGIAADEDVDVVGLSVLSGAHEEYCRRVHKALAEAGLDDVVLVVGGTISWSSEGRSPKRAGQSWRNSAIWCIPPGLHSGT